MKRRETWEEEERKELQTKVEHLNKVNEESMKEIENLKKENVEL